MTKEEIIETFKFVIRKCDCIINNKYYTADDYVQDKVEDIAEMCHRILDGQFGEIIENKLPSNLDDAVFAYEDSSECPSANQEEERMVYDAFKAGAKWMAEQGISCEAEAVKDVGISFLKGAFEKATKEFDGKVIVQIRKKED